MGWNPIKSVTNVVRSVGSAVTAPIKATVKLAQGDLSGATKEVGKGVGATFNAATLNVADSSDVHKFLDNKTVRALTLNTSKELSYVGKGFNQLQSKGEADSNFYQSAFAIGGKAALAYGLPLAASSPAVQSAFSGATFGGVAKGVGTGLLVSKALGSGQPGQAVDTLTGSTGFNQADDLFRRQPSSVGGSYYSSGGGGYADEASLSPSILPLALIGVLGFYLVYKKRK